MIASEYDDFYFGTYDEEGNMITTPREFMETDNAKKFLNFNDDVSTFEEKLRPDSFMNGRLTAKKHIVSYTGRHVFIRQLHSLQSVWGMP